MPGIQVSSVRHVLDITLGTDLPDGVACDALIATAACTVTGIDAQRKAFTAPLAAGVNFIGARRIDTVSTGTVRAGYF